MPTVLSGGCEPRDVHAGAAVRWPFSLESDSAEAAVSVDIATGPDSSDSPEWNVALNDSVGEVWSNYRGKHDFAIPLPGGKPKELELEIICPKGARYGDTVTVAIRAGGSALEFTATARQSIMVLKTQIDQERTVADMLHSKANLGEKDIYAILSPGNLRGYVFVEGMNTDRMREKTREIRKARSFIDGETSIEEIDHYLTPLSTVIGIVEGDLVELVNGPFKGEKARVQQIDQCKEEITVELIEAMVPIPVTVKGDSVRVIEKEK